MVPTRFEKQNRPGFFSGAVRSTFIGESQTITSPASLAQELSLQALSLWGRSLVSS